METKFLPLVHRFLSLSLSVVGCGAIHVYLHVYVCTGVLAFVPRVWRPKVEND